MDEQPSAMGINERQAGVSVTWASHLRMDGGVREESGPFVGQGVWIQSLRSP